MANQTTNTATTQPWHAQYAPGVPQSITHLLGENLVELLDKRCQQYAERVCLYSLGGQLRYKELHHYSLLFSRWLRAHGLQKGQRVLLMMPNLMQSVVGMLGILRAGGVVVTCNPLYTVRELSLLLQDAQPRVLFIAQPFVGITAQAIARSGLQPMPTVVVTRIGDLHQPWRRLAINFFERCSTARQPYRWFQRLRAQRSARPPMVTFKRALALGAQLDRSAQHPLVAQSGQPAQQPPASSHSPATDQPSHRAAHNTEGDEQSLTAADTAFLLYTGGTTGQPKGVRLSHGNMVANLYQVSTWLGSVLRPGQETVLTALPMYHVFSLLGNCLLFLKLGGSNVLITDGRKTRNLVRAWQKYPITAFTGVNTLFRRLLAYAPFHRCDFSTLRVVIGGGTAVEPTVAFKWQTTTALPLLQAYGLTETSPAVCINPANGHHIKASLGLPLPSTIVRIIDEQGNHLPTGQTGEICIKGPQVMQGYLNRDEANKQAFTADGFFRSGDMGYIDEQGYVYLQDRKSDIINVSGFQVYPTEVEAVIGRLVGVSAVAVIGLPDKQSGEMIKAYIQKTAKGPSLKTLRRHCRANLTQYKIPREFEFVEQLPLSAVGKVLRRKLKEQALAQRQNSSPR